MERPGISLHIHRFVLETQRKENPVAGERNQNVSMQARICAKKPEKGEFAGDIAIRPRFTSLPSHHNKPRTVTASHITEGK